MSRIVGRKRSNKRMPVSKVMFQAGLTSTRNSRSVISWTSSTLCSETTSSFRHFPIICSSWSVSIHPNCLFLINEQLELSSPPASSTLAHAEILLTTERSALEEPPELTWKHIMEEEPFEGEHWEEIGTSNRSRRSTPSYGSDSDSDDIRSRRSENSTRSTLSCESPSHHHNTAIPPTLPINEALQNRMTVEDLQGKQYWRADWRGDMNLDAPFRLADPASFGPTVSRPSLVSIPSVVSSRVHSSVIPDMPVALHQ